MDNLGDHLDILFIMGREVSTEYVSYAGFIPFSLFICFYGGCCCHIGGRYVVGGGRLGLNSYTLVTSLLALSSYISGSCSLAGSVSLAVRINKDRFTVPKKRARPVGLDGVLSVRRSNIMGVSGRNGCCLLRRKSRRAAFVSISKFRVGDPEVGPVAPRLAFPVPPLTNVPPASVPTSLPGRDADFRLGDSGLPASVRSLSSVGVNVRTIVRLSCSRPITDGLRLARLGLAFPRFVGSGELRGKVLGLRGRMTADASNCVAAVPMSNVSYGTSNIAFAGKASFYGLLVRKAVLLSKGIDLGAKSISSECRGRAISMRLGMSVALQSRRAGRRVVDVGDMGNIMRPGVGVSVTPMALSRLPSFLSSRRIALSMRGPVMFFATRGGAPIGTGMGKAVATFASGSNMGGPVKSPMGGPIGFDFALGGSKSNDGRRFYLSPVSPGGPSMGRMRITGLPALVGGVPSVFRFTMRAGTDASRARILLKRACRVVASCSIGMPFMFNGGVAAVICGSDMSN